MFVSNNGKKEKKRTEKSHLSAFKVFHRQFTPASLDTIVVAVPPSAR